MNRLPTDKILELQKLAKKKFMDGVSRMYVNVPTVMQLCANLENERFLKEEFAKEYLAVKDSAEKEIVNLIKLFGGNPIFFKLAQIIGIHLVIPVCNDSKEPNCTLEVSDAHAKKSQT